MNYKPNIPEENDRAIGVNASKDNIITLDQETIGSVGVDNNLSILYITFAIMIGIMLLWIIIIVVFKDDPLKILTEMSNLATHVKPVSDKFLQQSTHP